jgi:hypothetical protein
MLILTRVSSAIFAMSVNEKNNKKRSQKGQRHRTPQRFLDDSGRSYGYVRAVAMKLPLLKSSPAYPSISLGKVSSGSMA